MRTLLALFVCCCVFAATLTSAVIVKHIDVKTHDEAEHILLKAINQAHTWYNDDTCDGPTFVTYKDRRALLIHCELDVPLPLPQNVSLGFDTYIYRIPSPLVSDSTFLH